MRWTIAEESFARILEERLSRRLDPLLDAIGSLTKENAALKMEVKQLREDHENLRVRFDDTLEVTMNEISDRQSRQANLIISGIQEKEDGSLEERREQDAEVMWSIFQFLDCSGVLEVKNIQRIGRLSSNRPRLLKVELGNSSQRNAILRNVRLLRRSSWDFVYINPDFTEKERVHNRKMRDELKARRNSGEDVVLYRGKIVPKMQTTNFR